MCLFIYYLNISIRIDLLSIALQNSKKLSNDLYNLLLIFKKIIFTVTKIIFYFPICLFINCLNISIRIDLLSIALQNTKSLSNDLHILLLVF